MVCSISKISTQQSVHLGHLPHAPAVCDEFTMGAMREHNCRTAFFLSPRCTTNMSFLHDSGPGCQLQIERAGARRRRRLRAHCRSSGHANIFQVASNRRQLRSTAEVFELSFHMLYSSQQVNHYKSSNFDEWQQTSPTKAPHPGFSAGQLHRGTKSCLNLWRFGEILVPECQICLQAYSGTQNMPWRRTSTIRIRNLFQLPDSW